ncbi:MAG TPA: hypothetical protein PKE08_00235 [Candidatus Paceibacterota bacterium]|nr:hypothetical protein [Candidatus Paceibacterota bacterium]
MIAADLTRQMKAEGHDVKLYIEDKTSKESLDNIVKKTSNWRNELEWVGRNGLIIFDDIGYGKIQDNLRKQGYVVFGGNELGDKLETDREYGQKIFKECGLKTVELKDFNDIDDAVNFVKKNPKAWVIKQNDHGSKSLNYVGHFQDGRDVISVLKNYLQNKNINREKITLHERIYGVEIGVGRYFNGTNWVGPIEYNVEHKMMFPGDIGPSTSEMGTLAWYDDNENIKLYKQTLEKMKPYLQKIDFRGDMEINFIVNEHEAIPLEASPRFGSPIIHLHKEIHMSPWGEFLYNIAKGQDYKLKWKKGYGIVVLLAIPPFPYGNDRIKNDSNLLHGINIYFDNIKESDFQHIHFEDISARLDNSKQLYITGKYGYAMYVTGIDETISVARKKVYDLTKKIIIPKMFYRIDIGEKFDRENIQKLKKWGWL